jgi:hypothetical protein
MASSRRDFLKNSAIAGAALSLSGATSAANAQNLQAQLPTGKELPMQTTGELEYEVRGDGDPILFIHGAFDEAALVPVRDALDGYRRVLYH